MHPLFFDRDASAFVHVDSLFFTDGAVERLETVHVFRVGGAEDAQVWQKDIIISRFGQPPAEGLMGVQEWIEPGGPLPALSCLL